MFTVKYQNGSSEPYLIGLVTFCGALDIKHLNLFSLEENLNEEF